MTGTYLNVAQSMILIFGLVVAFISQQHCLDSCRSSRKAFMLFSILLTFNQLGFLPDKEVSAEEASDVNSQRTISEVSITDRD